MAETNNVTNLRQAESVVKVCGLLSEKSLKVEQIDGVDTILGSLTIKTSDVNFIRFPVRVAAKKKDKTDNSMYASFVTIMNEYKAIADKDVGEELADKIMVDTSKNRDGINLYHDKQTGVSKFGFKTNFFNRVKNAEDYEPKAEFEIEVYIKSITPEMKKIGEDVEETGRMLVHGWVPTYNGIEQITLVAEDEVASAIESTFTAGQTVRFYGDIINNRVETTVTIPMAIGKPKVEKRVEYKNDMLITGASEAYEEGITPFPPYDKAVIDKAIQERENKIAEEKAKSQNPSTNSTPSAAALGRKLPF